MMMLPEVGVSNPATIRRIVVLPQPDGPSKETNSPLSMPRFTVLTTWVAPKDLVDAGQFEEGHQRVARVCF